MEIKLGYGQGTVTFNDEGRFEVLAATENDVTRDAPLSDPEIGAALDDPIDSPPLEEIVSPNESVLIVVSDATRATASAQIVNLLVRRLIELTIAPTDIRVIFATGIHRFVTPQEKSQLLTPFITQRIRTLDHNPTDEASLINLGETERGTPIEVNRALQDFSHVITTGGINFHYFAGFTGGRKSICPGLASARTIAATHLLALDFATNEGGIVKRRAGVGLGRLDGNAVHEECERIAAAVAPSFAINTVVNKSGRATRVYAGDWRAAHREGCAEYASEHVLPIKEKRALVVASCGGWPYDINLIQAHKAIEMAAYACTEGGTIILLAECADGTGRADFTKWFTGESASVLAGRLRTQYEVNGQTAWALLTKTERFRIVLVSSLAPDVVRQMNMTPAASLDEAMKEIALETRGYVIPEGATYLPLAQRS